MDVNIRDGDLWSFCFLLLCMLDNTVLPLSFLGGTVDVERRFNVSFKDNAEYRKNLTGPDEGVHPNANSWRSGKGLEPASREVDCE